MNEHNHSILDCKVCAFIDEYVRCQYDGYEQRIKALELQIERGGLNSHE
jgi:hypothetical protein